MSPLFLIESGYASSLYQCLTKLNCLISLPHDFSLSASVSDNVVPIKRDIKLDCAGEAYVAFTEAV